MNKKELKAVEARYLVLGGKYCPNCQSESIVAGPVEVDGRSAHTEVECEECHATWQEVFTLTGIDNLNVPSGQGA